MYVEPYREEIQRLRLEKNLSMAGLSLCAGLSSASVLRIEKGITKKISDLRARELARALGCELGQICKLPPAGKDRGDV